MNNPFDEYILKVEKIKRITNAKEAGMGESVLGCWPDVLYTYGLGPCLAVALYDTKCRKGTLAHVSITSASREMELAMPERQLKHTGERVVETLLWSLAREGSEFRNIEARIVGEKGSWGNEHHSPKVKQSLWKYGIPLVGEKLGGNAKSIIMYLDNGEIEVFELGLDPYFI